MRSLAALALLGALSAVAAENRLVVESAAGRAGPVGWQSFSLEIEPGESGSWHLTVDELVFSGQSLSLAVTCTHGGLRASGPWCREGQFDLHGADGRSLSGRLVEGDDERPGLSFELAGRGLTGVLYWSAENVMPPAAATLRFDGFELAQMPVALDETLGLSVLEGRLDGRVDWSGRTLTLDLGLTQGAFDRPDGLVAAGGLSLALSSTVRLPAEDEAGSFSFDILQDGGEILAGPIYLPAPPQPLRVELAGSFDSEAEIAVDTLRLRDGETLQAQGQLDFTRRGQDWQLSAVDIEQARLTLPSAWERWGEGLAATWGLGGLETEGELTGSLSWRPRGLASVYLTFDAVGARDARGRFAIDGLNGSVEQTEQRVGARLDWSRLSVFKLSFGASDLAASGRPGDWALTRALRLPLLDGAVVVDALAVAPESTEGRSLNLDLRIEPLDLAGLTRMLDFPVFGGKLSGRFPGVRLSGDRIAFTGGIDMQAFSGRISLSDLVVERAFGALPALAAQVEIERLDLAEVTGAFNFGHMEGQVSGWMRDLRLLDWQPVAMDARLFTHDDAPSRRISQRAVENLSRLGGGAAAIGATLLRMFEEFPYRRAGLACRLDRNICHIDGVAPHPSGGFYIVEGRGLPHLDVVGHRRLIDWPRLVSQLVAATER